MSKTLHRNLQAKMDSMKGPEWDSSDDEEEDKVVVPAKISAKAMNTNKSSKKSKDKADTLDEKEKDATVLYIGHLPNEFEERDLKNFLQQFGKVLNIRISRSVKSGHSRGYAFARFEDAETTRIVAETLQGYFVGQRRLICHPIPNPPRNMFYDTDKVIERRQLRLKKAEKERQSQLNNMEKIKVISSRLVKRERSLRSKFQKLGIEYDFPGYQACVEDRAQEKKRQGSETTENARDESAKSNKESKKQKVSVDSPVISPSSRKRKDSVGSESSASKKSKKESKDKAINEERTTPSSERKDKDDSKKVSTQVVEGKNDKRNTPSSTKDMTTPASKQKETKSPSSSKKETTPASKQKETKSPTSSKKENTTPSNKRTPQSSKKENATPLSETKKNSPADSKATPNKGNTSTDGNKNQSPANKKDTRDKSLTHSATKMEQPSKRKQSDVTPTKTATEKPVMQSEVKTKKNKKNKKRRESAP